MHSQGNHRGIKGVLLALIAFGLVAAGYTLFGIVSRSIQVKGLLVDLELEGPDPSRYSDLRDMFLKRLPSRIPALNNFPVNLDYVHFSAVHKELFDRRNIDFVLLSPQGTPWHRYRNGAAEQLEFWKQLLQDMISNDWMPVLGICGGHQFLALTFGGSVDFIDPAFERKSVPSYPKEARAERGAVKLETVVPDPIFKGVAIHPGEFWVMESHYEEVKSIGAPLINLARSAVSEIQLIRIPGRCVYGVAFHPERDLDSSHELSSSQNSGTRILANFVGMVVREKLKKGAF